MEAIGRKFVNYTRTHIGAMGVPLSYVIREYDDPETDETYTDFITQTIHCAPLTSLSHSREEERGRERERERESERAIYRDKYAPW